MMVATSPEIGVGPAPLAVDLRSLYESERSSLLRLAWLLVHDAAEAEEIVQDAFVKAHVSMARRLDDPAKAAAYLRSAVLNGARSRLRRRQVARRHPLAPIPPAAGAEVAALAELEHERVLAALARLPRRQRECLVLRYYLDLPVADIALALGVSAGSVKTHIHRGLAALAELLEDRG